MELVGQNRAWDPVESHGDYGTVAFASHTVASKAEFLRITHADELKLEALHEKGDGGIYPLMSYMAREWFQDMPKLLLRVIGTVDPEVEDAVTNEIMEDAFKATSAAQGWVITCGNEHEVPGMVGRQFDRLRASVNAPIIGVNAWSTIERREQFNSDPRGKPLKGKGVRRTYRDPKPDDILETRPLSPFHTHFLFFGGKPFADENAFPSEFPEDQVRERTDRVYSGALSAILEKEVAAYMAANRMTAPPRVLLLIGGDASSLGEVRAFYDSGGFIVAAQDSGGLAAVLAEYALTSTIPPSWAAHKDAIAYLAPKSKDSIGRGGSPPGRGTGEAPHRLSCVTVRGSETIFSAIQEAVMTQLSPVGGSDERIFMAVAWGDAERLQYELRFVPIWEERRAEVLARVLQIALDYERVECVRVALHNGAPAKDVDLCKLYWDKLFDTTNPPQFYLFEGIKKPPEGSPPPPALTRAQTSVSLVPSNSFSKLEELDPSRGWEDYFPPAVWQLLYETVPGLVKYWKNKLRKANERAEENEFLLKSGAPPESLKSTKVGCRVVDLYVWAVLLGNTEMALTMLPFVQEPMRASIIGACLCIMMSTKLPLHVKKLEEAKDQHEDFALTLLDLCDSFGEARRMLTTRSRHWNRTVLDLAVQAHLLRFCEHRYCQLLCDEMMRGSLDFGQSTVLANHLTSKAGLWGAMQIIGHGLMPLPFPGILTAIGAAPGDPSYPDDSMFAIGWVKRQTAFVTERELEQDRRDGKREVLMLRSFYLIPLVRQLLRLFSYMVFVMLYSYTVVQPNLAGGHTDATGRMLWILAIWTIALGFDEWNKWASDAATFDFDFWKKYDWSVIACTLISMLLGLYDWHWTYDGLEIVVVLAWCRLLKFLQLSQPIGVLTIMIMAMLKDIALWALVSIVFTCAFAVAFLATSHGADGGPWEVATMPIWAMLGNYDVDEVSAWSPSVGNAMLWIFIVVSNILLVNLLIAMMGDTYATIKENSDAEWKIGRLRSVQEAVRQMHPVPPPVNLPITFVKFLVNRGGRDDAQKKSAEEEKKLAEDWMVGGKLWEAKREKDRVARTLLSKLTKRRAEEAANEEKIDVVDERLRYVEKMLERLGEQVTAIASATVLAPRTAPPESPQLPDAKALPAPTSADGAKSFAA